MICALAIRSSEMRFAVGMGRGVSSDFAAAARDLVAPFQGMSSHTHTFRSALVLTDALAGHAENLVDHLTVLTGGAYQFFGGGAGDDARFGRTYVFCGTDVSSDAVVALEILSNKPLGIGVRHGWEPASAALRVTESDGMRLISLNAISAVEVFEEHAAATNQRFDPADPLPFFLHNILGIETGAGHKLRVPLSVNPDGSIACAAEIPAGATVHLMKAARSAQAGSTASRSGLEGLGHSPPEVAIVFDCVASRLRMGAEYGSELDQIAHALAPAKYLGCNTYGQIARAEGQFGGFHNCTAVVCVFPA
ncbi:MAG TPA: FIST N-terminal domain-containing protein [Thermoanaerobaculia bacterium]|nr:FIST N-terminal domain-containing protein [Thermoanaerobaculia bacterium]